jgi:hypothetical protein
MHRAKGTPTKECGWKHDGQSHDEKKDVRERTLDMPSHGRNAMVITMSICFPITGTR